MRFFVMTMILSSISCATSTMVNSPNQSPSKFAPVNEATRAGTVKYLNQGASFVVKARREHAYEQMFKSCNGKYKIVSEGPRAEGGIAMPMGSGTYYDQTEYWYISFECVIQ
ncbi:MAG: hypothetical protein AB7F86_09620 [Bdellovibrionales bacterium]